jgi:PPOX class probable FMN-dependent enzyme
MDGDSIGSKTELRAKYGEPSERAVRKQLARLDGHCRHVIALSPFLVIATSGGDGLSDASPRGDAPGFVAVLDDVTILIPDRPGNNRTDTLRNIIDRPGVGLIFFVPGVNETLRINGHARISTEAALLAPLAVGGKAPRSGLVVAIEEVYMHCAKALIRSKLWDGAYAVPKGSFPSISRMVGDQVGFTEEQKKIAEARTEIAYRDGLWAPIP